MGLNDYSFALVAFLKAEENPTTMLYIFNPGHFSLHVPIQHQRLIIPLSLPEEKY